MSEIDTDMRRLATTSTMPEADRNASPRAAIADLMSGVRFGSRLICIR